MSDYDFTPADAIPEFQAEQDAIDWVCGQFDDSDNPDNYRIGYRDDPASMAEFDRIEAKGCCGSFEADIAIAGRLAVIGCNYGH